MKIGTNHRQIWIKSANGQLTWLLKFKVLNANACISDPRINIRNTTWVKMKTDSYISYKETKEITLSLLMNSYSSQKMRIKWNGTYTDIFTICNEKKTK